MTDLCPRYGVNPIPYLPNLSPEQVEMRKAEYKRGAIQLKRELLKTPEGRQHVRVDRRGEPVWDEAVNGEFVVLVVKTNKGDGLTEFGRI